MTELEYVEDALKALEGARIGVAILKEWKPQTADAIGAGITALYEGLVELRDHLMGETDEQRLADDRAKVTKAAQDYAAARFGAMPGGGRG